jgi:hypothetical protein
MNTEIKAKWVAALRSGKYRQAKHVLKGDDGMCCLGVLCDLYIQETEGKEWKERPIDNIDPTTFQKYKAIGTFGGSDVVPPVEVVKWANLPKENPYTGITTWGSVLFTANQDFEQSYSLADLNDNGLTFSQIADVIEFVL